MDKNESAGRELRGIRLVHLSILSVVLMLLLAAALLYVMHESTTAYDSMRHATEAYISARQDASNLRAGSDYLTAQSRAFVMTANREHVDGFMEEIEVTRSRESAVDNISENLQGTDAARYLSEAVRCSDELLQRELYAMRLTLNSMGEDMTTYSERLQQVPLSEEDLALDAQQQRTRAQGMLFDDYYLSMKAQINSYVDLCVETLIADLKVEQEQSTERFQNLMLQQRVFTGVLLGLLLVLVLTMAVLVIRPLRMSAAQIQKNEKLPLIGSYELKNLAKTYNEMYEKDRSKREELSYQATHDPLTGLYNRSAFDDKRRACEGRHHALILVDVDHFKEINDTYGHAVGDKVLQKVSALLQASFRSEDSVCRIGGDEFAIVMVYTGPELAPLIRRKMETVIARLKQQPEGLPPVGLSVGVAFGSQAVSGERLFQQADAALYQVKDAGKGACAFYPFEAEGKGEKA